MHLDKTVRIPNVQVYQVTWNTRRKKKHLAGQPKIESPAVECEEEEASVLPRPRPRAEALFDNGGIAVKVKQ